MSFHRAFLSCLALNFAVGLEALRAEVTLAPLFRDHAVLQREKPIPIWGRADVGEKIAVAFSGQQFRTTADAEGRWMVFLEPLPAIAEGSDLVVTAKNTVVIHDVVVGEVWLSAGAFHLDQPVAKMTNGAAEIAAANFPLIRELRISPTIAERPAERVNSSGWLNATAESVGGFSGVDYFFARDIFQKLGVPVGLIHSSCRNTPIESWLSPAALGTDPAGKDVVDRWEKQLAEYPEKKAGYESKLAEWRTAEASAKTQGEAAHLAFLKQRREPAAPRGPGDPWTPGGLFNGMINPLLPYALRGALWDQGENNSARGGEYQALFRSLIASWRQHFGQGEFPFYWVNLPALKKEDDPTGLTLAVVREAQTRTLALPNTGQALAIDCTALGPLDPADVQAIGRRLALLAKHRVYGVTVDDVGPTFLSAQREGNAMRVRFTHAGSGLVAHDKPVQSLEVSGTDKVFRAAVARIERETLLVSSPEVREPVAVRYAWRNHPEANLYSGAGLPAVPFRSDDW